MSYLDTFMPAFSDELTKISKELTESDRDHMSKKTFALPKSEEYPIPDAQHARSALGFAAMHHKGTAEEAKVRAAVHKKFPGLEKQAGALDRRGSALAFLKEAEPENGLAEREASAPGWLEAYRGALGA